MCEIKPNAMLLAFCLALMVALGSGAAAGDQPSSGQVLRGKELVEALRRGGYIVYFRHGATNADQTDADRPDFARCETQRNLSDDGRRMARDIGAAFKALGIRVGKVVASPYCRAADTAELAFGRREVSSDLYFAVGVDKDERARQGVRLRELLSTPPTAGTNTILVSHHANLKEATGIWPKREGDAHVFRPGPTGFTHLGEVSADEWVRWAREAAATR